MPGSVSFSHSGLRAEYDGKTMINMKSKSKEWSVYIYIYIRLYKYILTVAFKFNCNCGHGTILLALTLWVSNQFSFWKTWPSQHSFMDSVRLGSPQSWLLPKNCYLADMTDFPPLWGMDLRCDTCDTYPRYKPSSHFFSGQSGCVGHSESLILRWSPLVLRPLKDFWTNPSEVQAIWLSQLPIESACCTLQTKGSELIFTSRAEIE